MPTYYTYKAEIPLQPGQTLGFTSGKGYYAAGTPTPSPAPTPTKSPSGSTQTSTTPTPPKPPPSATSTTTSSSSTAAQTTTQPKAANTPAKPNAAPTSTATRTAAATTDTSDSTAYYTRPDDVPLLPGQTLGFTAGKGYYAVGRPQPVHASTTPIASKAVVTAISAKASTTSPLVEDISTSGKSVTIKLYHATKPTDTKVPSGTKAKSEESPAEVIRENSAKTQVKKASSLVHDQIAQPKTRQSGTEVRSNNILGGLTATKAIAATRQIYANAVHPKTISTLPTTNRSSDRTLQNVVPITFHKTSKTFTTRLPHFTIKTSIDASVTDASWHIDYNPRSGYLALSRNSKTIREANLGGVNRNYVQVAEDLVRVKNLITAIGTRNIHGFAVSLSPTEINISGTYHSVHMNLAYDIKTDSVVVVSSTTHPQDYKNFDNLEVGLTVTTAITPNDKTGRRPPPPNEPVDVWERIKKIVGLLTLIAAAIAAGKLGGRLGGGTKIPGLPGPTPGPTPTPALTVLQPPPVSGAEALGSAAIDLSQ